MYINLAQLPAAVYTQFTQGIECLHVFLEISLVARIFVPKVRAFVHKCGADKDCTCTDLIQIAHFRRHQKYFLFPLVRPTVLREFPKKFFGWAWLYLS